MSQKLFDAVARALAPAGVEHLFGIPGTQSVGLYESLRRAGVACTLTTHEAGAAFAAGAWFRAGGQLAAASVIPGPGFTNALTAVAEARHDSAALLLITHAPAVVSGRVDPLQAIDQFAIAAPLVKGAFRIATPDAASETLLAAARLAGSGEPGPVLVELGGEARRPEIYAVSDSTDDAEQTDFHSLAARLRGASRPVLLCGAGAASAAAGVQELAHRLGCPVITTTSGRGVVSEADPHNLRFECATGAASSVNALLSESDLVLALGCKLGHNGSAGFQLDLPAEKLVRVDVSAAMHERNFPSSLFVQARCEDAVAALLSADEISPGDWTAAEISKARDACRAESLERLSHSPVFADTPELSWEEFYRSLRDVVEDDAYVITDSGHHQVMTRVHWEVRMPRSFLVPADYQSMGFALPTALGAGTFAPERQLVVIIGDGGIAMGGMELMTLLRAELRVAVIVFNDGRLGQIDAMQAGYSGVSFQTDLRPLDLRAWSASLGCEYSTLTANVRESIHAATQRPGVLDLRLSESPALIRQRRASRIKHPLKRAIQR